MPAIKCRCGAMTNSAISEYWLREDLTKEIADGCYAKWVNDHYEEGCLFQQTPPEDFMRIMATKLILNSKIKGVL